MLARDKICAIISILYSYLCFKLKYVCVTCYYIATYLH